MWLVGVALVVGSCSVAHSAVIVTTTGEEIVCEIIKETDTYFVVNHRGYRRYVLKSQIRTLNREAGEGYDLGPMPQRFVSLSGGLLIYGHNQKAGFSGGRLTMGFPVNEHLLLEGNLHTGCGTVKSAHGQADMLSGPLYWVGGTIGGLWHLQTWRIVPLFDAGVGYFLLNHSVTESERQWAAMDSSLTYAEPIGNGLGLTMGAGGMMPISPRLALTLRVSILVIHTKFNREWRLASGEGEPYTSPHGVLLRLIQTHVGLQMTF